MRDTPHPIRHGCQPAMATNRPHLTTLREATGSGPWAGRGARSLTPASPAQFAQRVGGWFWTLLLLAVLATAAVQTAWKVAATWRQIFALCLMAAFCLVASACVSAKGDGKAWSYQSVGTDSKGLTVGGEGMSAAEISQSGTAGKVIDAVGNASLVGAAAAAAMP